MVRIMLVKSATDRTSFVTLLLAALFLVTTSLPGIYYGDAISSPMGLISSSGVFPIQIQSDMQLPNTENNLNSANPTNTPGSTTNNEATSSESDKSENNTASTGSSDQSNDVISTPNTVRCEGSALCVMGEVVKVVNGKTLYVNIDGKVYKVELALINLPVQYEQAMRELTTFTRNTCLGSTVLIDQDDGQKVNSFMAQVYCSPTKNLNSLLLDTGYVQLETSQCQSSEFSKLDWAKSHGC